MNLKTPIGRLRILAILEGISYLLLGLTMPLKYILKIPQPNYVVGMVHGVLFIAYIILAIHNWIQYKWPFRTAFFVGLASLIPLGTFILDAKILKPFEIKLNDDGHDIS